MANVRREYTSTDWSVQGIVMKSAFISNKLSICCMNAQSICARRMSKVVELRQIAKVSNVDVICITESWLNINVSSDVLDIEGYTIVRNDRVGRLGGGILVYLKKNINFKIIEASSNDIGTPETEFIFVEISIDHRKVLMGFFYNPPELDCSQVIHDKLTCLKYQYDHIYLMGDFNTNIINTLSEKVKRFCATLQCLSLSSLGRIPTHFHRTGASLIDMIITNDTGSVLRFNQIEVPFLSNHDLLFASLDFDLLPNNNTRTFRDYSRINSSKVIELYNRIEWNEFYSIDNPDYLVPFFNNHIENIFDSCVPLKTVHNHPRSNPWFNQDISKAMIDRDLAYRVWKVSKCDTDY